MVKYPGMEVRKFSPVLVIFEAYSTNLQIARAGIYNLSRLVAAGAGWRPAEIC